MQAIFLNTFYATNLSGASYAVDRRIELFQRHHVNTKVITTNFYITNRYYFISHFPDKVDGFCDLTDILTDNIFVKQQNAWQNHLQIKEKNYQLDYKKRRAVAINGSYFLWYCYPDGRLLSMNYYNRSGDLLRIDSFDWRGYLSTHTYYSYDSINEKSYMSKREHLNSEGGRRIVYYFGNNSNLRRVDWIHTDQQIETFFNENDLMVAALQYYTQNEFEQYMIIADLFITNTLAKLKILNQKSNTRVLVQLHNIQLKETAQNVENIRIGYSYPILNHDQYSGIIALTLRQKNDIDELIGSKSNNIYRIPENWFSMEDVKKHSSIQWQYKEEGLIVVSARLDSVKQIDHVIVATIYAHQRSPKIHLEIWGGGPEKDKLQKLIDENKATSFIQLKGVTNHQNMQERFVQAQLHVLTSKHEGLPMVLFEAQLGQAPSICYDIDYGPDDMITNRVNGDLVAANDQKYLAMRIEELFNEPEQGTLQYYALNSQNTIMKYSEETVWQLWQNLMEKIFKNENNYS